MTAEDLVSGLDNGTQTRKLRGHFAALTKSSYQVAGFDCLLVGLDPAVDIFGEAKFIFSKHVCNL